jgi:type I restriction enzyme R subunit
MDTYIYSGQEPIGDAVFIGLDNRPSILEARSIGERILDKIKEFIEVFVSGMLG